MKRPNGSGGIRKLSGKRSKPYQAVVTNGLKWNGEQFVQDQRSLGVFRTRAEALAALADYQLNPVNLDGRDLTFEDVYELIKPDFKESMIAVMRASFRRLKPILGDKKVTDIRKRELDMVADMMNGTSESTQNGVKILVTRVFKYAMENDYIQKDYSQFLTFKDVKAKKEKSAFSPEDIRQLLGLGPYFSVMLHTGMRPNELVNMKSENVYEEDGILCFHVTQSKTAAGIRTIPVHSCIEGLLALDQEYVIQPHKTYKQADTMLKKSQRSGTISPGHTLHDLRRTFATYAKHCHMDEFCRKAIMGHAQSGITDIVYTDAMVKDLKQEMEKLKYRVTYE